MKIHFIIEFDTDETGTPKRMKIERLTPVEAGPKLAKIAATAPPPIPAEPEPDAPKVDARKNSGNHFDAGFLAIVRDIPEPFTRRALAVATGLNPTDTTLRITRLKNRGWVEQPAPGLWRKTKAFGVKA